MGPRTRTFLGNAQVVVGMEKNTTHSVYKLNNKLYELYSSVDANCSISANGNAKVTRHLTWKIIKPGEIRTQITRSAELKAFKGLVLGR